MNSKYNWVIKFLEIVYGMNKKNRDNKTLVIVIITGLTVKDVSHVLFYED
jgi:hypothetical protein